ncbi:MAG: hypothetical protein ACKERG_00790 [Candidatus Hodgkinia cicadicola]
MLHAKRSGVENEKEKWGVGGDRRRKHERLWERAVLEVELGFSSASVEVLKSRFLLFFNKRRGRGRRAQH